MSRTQNWLHAIRVKNPYIESYVSPSLKMEMTLIILNIIFIILISYEAVRKFAHDAINLILCTEKGMNLFQIDQDGETLDIDDWCDFMRTKKRFYQGKSLLAIYLANKVFIGEQILILH